MHFQRQGCLLVGHSLRQRWPLVACSVSGQGGSGSDVLFERRFLKMLMVGREKSSIACVPGRGGLWCPAIVGDCMILGVASVVKAGKSELEPRVWNRARN